MIAVDGSETLSASIVNDLRHIFWRLFSQSAVICPWTRAREKGWYLITITDSSGNFRMVGLEQFEEGGGVKDEPRSLSSSDVDDSINDPPSINVSDILSPTSAPSKPKKK